MTKLSHIPMQIQKWIASLTHLFFLILGLTGICLMYIHGNFGLGLTGIGSVPYEDTAEFNTQFNNDLNDIFLYMEYQDVFGADSSIDLSRRMLKMTFGPSETENFSLSSLISYLESMGYQLDDDFNCQKVSEPADGVKSREGYVEMCIRDSIRADSGTFHKYTHHRKAGGYHRRLRILRDIQTVRLRRIKAKIGH